MGEGIVWWVGDLLGNVARLEAKNVWLRVLAGSLAVAFPQQSISNPRSAFLSKAQPDPVILQAKHEFASRGKSLAGFV